MFGVCTPGLNGSVPITNARDVGPNSVKNVYSIIENKKYSDLKCIRTLITVNCISFTIRKRIIITKVLVKKLRIHSYFIKLKLPSCVLNFKVNLKFKYFQNLHLQKHIFIKLANASAIAKKTRE